MYPRRVECTHDERTDELVEDTGDGGGVIGVEAECCERGARVFGMGAIEIERGWGFERGGEADSEGEGCGDHGQNVERC